MCTRTVWHANTQMETTQSLPHTCRRPQAVTNNIVSDISAPNGVAPSSTLSRLLMCTRTVWHANTQMETTQSLPHTCRRPQAVTNNIVSDISAPNAVAPSSTLSRLLMCTRTVWHANTQMETTQSLPHTCRRPQAVTNNIVSGISAPNAVAPSSTLSRLLMCTRTVWHANTQMETTQSLPHTCRRPQAVTNNIVSGISAPNAVAPSSTLSRLLMCTRTVWHANIQVETTQSLPHTCRRPQAVTNNIESGISAQFVAPSSTLSRLLMRTRTVWRTTGRWAT